MGSRKNAEKTRGRPFQPGNPGRPKGARNAATVAAESLLDGEAEKLTRKAIELAFGGDVTALRLCMERILPPRKSRPISINLPTVENPTDVLTALSAVTTAVSNGELTPDEGQAIASLLEQSRRAQELVDIDDRLKKLEANTN